METTNKPVQKYRASNVTASIWKNVNGDSVIHAITLDRSYKDREGNWQRTTSLTMKDLPKAQLVLSEAYKFLAMHQEEDFTPLLFFSFPLSQRAQCVKRSSKYIVAR